MLFFFQVQDRKVKIRILYTSLQSFFSSSISFLAAVFLGSTLSSWFKSSIPSLFLPSIWKYINRSRTLSGTHKKVCCRYSLELPRQGNSNEYLQHTFLWRTDKTYPSIIIKYPPICSSATDKTQAYVSIQTISADTSY